MVFNATFNNISIISWLSVLLVEETGALQILLELSPFRRQTNYTSGIFIAPLEWKLSSSPLESRIVSKENSITTQILSLLTDCLDQFLIIQSFLEVTGNLSSPTKKQSIWLAYLYIQTISNRGSFSEKLSIFLGHNSGFKWWRTQFSKRFYVLP
jgi:hypothetical protein